MARLSAIDALRSRLNAAAVGIGGAHQSERKRNRVRHPFVVERVEQNFPQLRRNDDPATAIDPEQVAADPRDMHVVRQQRTQPPADRLQLLVAEAVTEGIDGFRELVDIDQGQHMIAGARNPGQLVDGLDLRGTIGQSSQLVDEGCLAQALDEADILATDGDVGAENVEEMSIQRADRRGRLDIEGKIASMAAGEMKRQRTLAALVLALAQAATYHLAHVQVGER